MFRKRILSAWLGVLVLVAASCAVEQPSDDEQTAAEPVAAETQPKQEGPYYELTKDDITSHPDWTSMNVTLKEAKIGDKSTDVQKQLGSLDKTEPVGPDHYRTAFEKSSYSIYTYKMTGELQKIELYTRFADQIKDPKFRKLLSTGNLDYMREAFGMEESAELNPNTTGMEYIYDAKGFRFAQYNLGAVEINSLIFSKIKQ